MSEPAEVVDIGVAPGDVLAGKYQVERVLGVGGMGVVVAAHHIQLETKVAIKFLLPEMLADQEAVSRFAREARAAVKITSEHVARVIDVGTLETGAPYMVMEYLQGRDLAAMLQQRGALPIEQAVEFVLQACVALAEAHSLGIVHRDLKPANLFCIQRPDGQLSVKVLDFGISKVTDVSARSGGGSVTKTCVVMGSPLPMSPEQMQSAKKADAQSDIWALGVILYELISGQLPFDGETLMEVGVKVATEAPPPITGFRPDVPPGLELIILRCLEKDKRRRWNNVAELAVALAPFAPKRARAYVERVKGTIQAAGLSASALALPTSDETADTVAGTETAPPDTRKAARAATAPPAEPRVSAAAGGSSRRWLVVGGVFAGVLVLAGAVVFLVRGPTTPVMAAAAPSAVASEPPPPGPVQAAPPSTAGQAATTPAPSAPSAAPSVADVPPPSPSVTSTTRPSHHGTQRAPAQVTRAHATAAPATPAGCDPPYTYDEQGHKYFKPECYTKN